MPQRFLRPGITTSKPWNSLDWIGQSFYVRIMTLVDDHGRFEADPLLLKSLAFPLNENVKKQQVEDMCQQMSALNLIIFYEKDGKKFLQLTKWKERIRSESKYPNPEQLASENKLLLTNDSKCQTSDNICMLPKPVAISHKPEPLVDEVVVFWNSIGSLPECQKLTEKRRKAIKAGLEDGFFSEHWKEALAKLQLSDFCTGKNDRGWKADIDWFLKPDSVPRIMEGKYDNREASKPTKDFSQGTGVFAKSESGAA